MQSTLPGILSRIVETKKREVAAKSAATAEWETKARQPRRPFHAALQAKPPSVIAEIKKASPSKGVLSERFEPSEQARQYAAGGAACLSVLTDATYFQGSLEHLQQARAAVSIPVLRKDFTIDELDVLEAAVHGADAILLIAAILDRNEMERYRLRAESYGMAALVEVHTGEELDRALESGARIIGVNNRDLNTFEVRLETSLHLAQRIPPGVLRVAESGIHGQPDLRRLFDAGYDAFLVGEHLMKSGDPAQALRALLA